MVAAERRARRQIAADAARVSDVIVLAVLGTLLVAGVILATDEIVQIPAVGRGGRVQQEGFLHAVGAIDHWLGLMAGVAPADHHVVLVDGGRFRAGADTAWAAATA